MTTIQPKTEVCGIETIEKQQEKRTGRFLLFFKTEWWETVKTTSTGNDIHIMTDKYIDHIYLNGTKVN